MKVSEAFRMLKDPLKCVLHQLASSCSFVRSSKARVFVTSLLPCLASLARSGNSLLQVHSPCVGKIRDFLIVRVWQIALGDVMPSLCRHLAFYFSATELRSLVVVSNASDTIVCCTQLCVVIFRTIE